LLKALGPSHTSLDDLGLDHVSLCIQMENTDSDMISSAWLLPWLAQDGRSLAMADLWLEVRKRVRS